LTFFIELEIGQSFFSYIVLFFFLFLLLPVLFNIEAVSYIVKKGGLLHHNDTQVIVCVCEKAREKRRKKVSYFNFVIFSRSTRMPTTITCVHALPHLTGLSINFESSSIVRMHVFLYSSSSDCIFLIYLKMFILFYTYLIRVSVTLFDIFSILHT
jgi:hypothetical protein